MLPRTVFAFVILFAVLGAAPAGAQALEIPAAWAGIWSMDFIDKDCETGEPWDNYTETDTLCTGDPLEFDQGGGAECTGSVDDTSVDITCESSEEIFTGCTVTIAVTLAVTRDGDSMTGSQRFEVIYTGDCGELTDSCELSEFTGTRTAPEPPTCGFTPVSETTWGTLKSLYRE